MDRVVSLLLEIVRLVDGEQGVWAADVKTNCCVMLNDVLSHNYRASSFVIDDGTGQDFTSVCLAVFKLIQTADCDAELAGVLCDRIQTLTSKVLTLSLVRNETTPMPCDTVSPEAAMASLRCQLNM